MSGPRRGVTADRTDKSEDSTDEARWRLEDQRDFLVRSLADLGAEHDAGDIEQRDFDALRRRDEERLAAVEAELADLARRVAAASKEPDPAARRVPRARSRRRPRWLAVVAVVALCAGTTLLVVKLASPRLPGQPITGSAAQNLAQTVQTQLAQATVLVNAGTATSLNQALALYERVLQEDPNQPQALAETGWLEWEAGYSQGRVDLEKAGRALVQRSLKVQPNDFGAHEQLGTIDLEQSHDASSAVTQYRAFLAEHPPKAQIAAAAHLIGEAFAEAGQPLPAGVPAG